MTMPAGLIFLSSNAQDFIEEGRNHMENPDTGDKFLSSNAQDFIEERTMSRWRVSHTEFLSSNAQDFIEEVRSPCRC